MENSPKDISLAIAKVKKNHPSKLVVHFNGFIVVDANPAGIRAKKNSIMFGFTKGFYTVASAKLLQ